MDWERQKRVYRRRGGAGALELHPRERSRHFSRGYDDRKKRLIDRVDRSLMREAIWSGYEERELTRLDRLDECVCDDCLGLYRDYFEWKDPRWSIVLPDLIR
jgi:hypothetical protein